MKMEGLKAMTYRGVQHLIDRMDDIQGHLRSAILADTTRDMATHSGEAQTLVDTLLQEVDDVLKLGAPDLDENSQSRRIERVMTQAARDTLVDAMNSAEKVGLAENVQEMRERLLDFKTHVDFADAHLHAAAGLDVS
jgi:phosphoribosylformylglycinamidine (FGAM) synthase-like enzyme